MSVRIQIAAIIYMMVQAVSFGIGAVAVLATPLKDHAMTLMPWVVFVSAAVSIPRHGLSRRDSELGLEWQERRYH